MKNQEIKEKFDQFVISKLAEELSMDVEDIDINADVLDYGIDSIAVSNIVSDMEKEYNLKLDPKVFFQSEDLEELLNNLWEGNTEQITQYYN